MGISLEGFGSVILDLGMFLHTGLGGSTVALFGKVGRGIYTKVRVARVMFFGM